MEVCKAIILKTANYTDTQKIVSVYSLEKGYLTFLSSVFLFRRKNQPFRMMQLVEIEYMECEKGNFHKLHSATPVVTLPHLYFDVVKMNVLLLWGEILHLLLRHEGKNEALFQFLSESVEYLDVLEQGIGNFNLLFLYRLSGFIGYKINVDTWQPGYLFNIQNGSFSPSTCLDGTVSGPNTAAAIYKLCSCPLQDVGGIPLNQSARNILMDIILLFFSTHLNISFNIKSIEVIREVFKA